MSNLNVKLLTIDTDRATLQMGQCNPVLQYITLIRGNEYVLCANCYASSYTNVFSTFETADVWSLYIGRQYENNAAPVITISDPVKFNNTSDWSSANVATGQISARVNVTSSALDIDLANNDSQQYTMELVLVNNASGKVMVSDSTVYIHNAVQI